MKAHEIRSNVRERYARAVRDKGSCCSCGCDQGADGIGRAVGYSEEELRTVPEGANLGLGCGNPTAVASLRVGETVLDLGSGAGFDAFLAADKVGPAGKVIGVDMTPDMIDAARNNASRGDYGQVEFRLGEIENIPATDASVDVVISNCVINLSTDKPQVFREAFRVLRPGGRLMVSDIVLRKELPDFIRNSMEAWTGCVAGAVLRMEYLDAVSEAGFREVAVLSEKTIPFDLVLQDPTARGIMEKMNLSEEDAAGIAGSVASVSVAAVKLDGKG